MNQATMAQRQRKAWVDRVAGIRDPAVRGRLARAELAAGQQAMRAERGRAARDLYAIHRSWPEVGRQLGVEGPTARYWATGQRYD